MILMCKDTLVAKKEDNWKVYRPELLPHNLDFLSEKAPDSYIRSVASIVPAEVGTKEQRASIIKNLALYNYRQDQFITWLSHRVLSIDRVNAKKILNALSLSQNQSPNEKAKIAIAYRAVNLCDS